MTPMTPDTLLEEENQIENEIPRDLQDQIDREEVRRLRREERGARGHHGKAHLGEGVPDARPHSPTTQSSPTESTPGSLQSGKFEEPQERRSFESLRRLPPDLVKRLVGGKNKKAKDDSKESKIVNRTLPLFSSITLPLVVVLCIPGLTEHWYLQVAEITHNPDGTTTVTRIDPSDPRSYAPNGALLDTAISISLALAIIANVALIMRMLERGWKRGPVFPTLVTICCLILHDIIDTIVCIVFGTVHAVNDGYDYTEAFWLTVGATIISFVTTTTLIIDWKRTPNFAEAGSGLTAVQRSLMISVVVLLCYMSLGALIYVFLEDLTYINSLYFITVISTTVGFGDLAPTTVGSKIVFMIYVIFAIILVGLTISNARVAIIETFQTQYVARRKRLAKKNKERKLARKEHRKLRLEAAKKAQEGLGDGKVEPEEKVVRPPPILSVRGAARPARVRDDVALGRNDTWSGRAFSFVKRTVGKQEDDTLTLEQVVADLTAIKTQDGVEEEREQQIERARQLQLLETDAPDLEILHQLSIANEEEYQALQNQLIREERWDYFYKIQVVLGMFIAFWLLGALAFHYLEGWNYFDAIYFVFVFSSTVGLGDFTPKSIAGRAVFIGFALVAIGVMTMLVFVLTEAGGAITRHLLARGVVAKLKYAQMDGHKKGDDPEGQRYKRQSASHTKAKSVQRQVARGIAQGRFTISSLLDHVRALDEHVEKVIKTGSRSGELPDGFDLDQRDEWSEEQKDRFGPGPGPGPVLAYRSHITLMTSELEELLERLDDQDSQMKMLGGHLTRLKPPKRPKLTRHLSLDSDTSDIESHSIDDSDDHDDEFDMESEFGDGFEGEEDEGEVQQDAKSQKEAKTEAVAEPIQPLQSTVVEKDRKTMTIPVTSLHSITLPLPSFDLGKFWRSRGSSGAAAGDPGLESRLDEARENGEIHASQPPLGYIGTPHSPKSMSTTRTPTEGLTRTNSVRFM